MKPSVILFCLCLTFFNVKGQWQINTNVANGFVDNFEVYNNELYATGFFTSLNSSSYNYLAKWNSVSWQNVGTGFNHAGHHLQTIGTDLYATIYQPAIDSNWLYKFDGINFIPFGEGVYLSNAQVGFSKTANLYNVIEYDSSIVVCGEFDRVGSKSISGIMKWNGSEWDSLGSGLLGNIAGTANVMYPHDMCVFGNLLIVCGNFATAGGQQANGVAAWDGNSWHSLGQGFNSTVYAICVFNGELYAGGDFTQSGSTTVSCFAKWNGSDWINPGVDIYYLSAMNYSFVHTLKVIQNKLIIAGGFDRVAVNSNVETCAAIIAYDGTNVDTLMGGIPGKEIEAVAEYDGYLFAGGGLNGSSYIGYYDLTSGMRNVMSDKGISIEYHSFDASFSISSEESIESVQILDESGKVVYFSAPKSKSIIFEFKNRGVFFTSINSGRRRVTKKLVLTSN